MDPDILDPGAIALVGLTLVGLVAVVGAYWTRWRRAELEAAIRQEELQLKRELLQRGMSAEEIVQVVSTRSGPPTEQTRRCRQQQQQQQQQWQS